MPAHTWTRVGRWGDAVRASLQAWQSDQKAAKGEGFLTYPVHDLQMLVYAASMDGQSAAAISAARGMAKLTGDPMYLGLALVRFGRFDEIDTMGERAGGRDFSGDVGLRPGICGASGWQRAGRATPSGSGVERCRILERRLQVPFGEDAARHARRNSGRRNPSEHGRPARCPRGVRTRRVARRLDHHRRSGAAPAPARHWLGAALLETKRFADAERVYRADLARHPHNGWSLLGLQRALEGQGRPVAVRSQIDRPARKLAAWIPTPRIRASRF